MQMVLGGPLAVYYSTGSGGDTPHSVYRLDLSGALERIAGNGEAGSSGGALDSPAGVATFGGKLYIADRGNNAIQEVDLKTGTMSRYAGTGSASSGQDIEGADRRAVPVVDPIGLAVDGQGNLYYVEGTKNRVRVVNRNGGTVRTVAGIRSPGGMGTTPATAQPLNGPYDLVLINSDLFILERTGKRIRKVDPAGQISTVLTFSHDSTGIGEIRRQLLLVDSDGGKLLQVNLQNGTATPIKTFPQGLTNVHGDLGNGTLLISMAGAGEIHKSTVFALADSRALVVDPASGFMGEGIPAFAACFRTPMGLAMDGSGNLFVSDPLDLRVRKIGADGVVTTVAGRGPGPNFGVAAASLWPFDLPGLYSSVAVDPTGRNLFFHASGGTRMLDFLTGQTRVTGFETATALAVDPGSPSGYQFAQGNRQMIYSAIAECKTAVACPAPVVLVGGANRSNAGEGVVATQALKDMVLGLGSDSAGNLFYGEWGTARVRMVNANGNVNTVAGNGSMALATDNEPATSVGIGWTGGMVVRADGSFIFSSPLHHRLYMVDNGSPRKLTVLAGSGTAGFSGDYDNAKSAQLNLPFGVASGPDGSIYFADLGNHRIRKIEFPNSEVSIETAPTGLQVGVETLTGVKSGPAPITVKEVGGTSLTARVVTPQAIDASSRWVFDKWAHDPEEYSTLFQEFPAGRTVYRAEFVKQFRLTVVSSNGGRVILPPEVRDGFGTAGTSGVLTAIADRGYVFRGWSGAARGTDPDAQVEFDAPKIVRAEFAPRDSSGVRLTVNSKPEGRIINIVIESEAEGTRTISGPTPILLNVPSRAFVRMTAGVQAGDRPSTRFQFRGWDQDTKVGPLEFLMTAARTVTANFGEQNQLTLGSTPATCGPVLATPNVFGGWYEAGTTVAISAPTSEACTFTGFIGDIESRGPSRLNIRMDKPRTIRATYTDRRVAVPFTVTTNPAGLLIRIDDGPAQLSPQTVRWIPGTRHSVVAVSPQLPTSGAGRRVFEGWMDNAQRPVSSRELLSVVAPTASSSYVARFKTQFPLALATDAELIGAVTLSADPAAEDGFYDAGARVNITAVTAADLPSARFVGWRGFPNTSARQTILMDGPRNEIAQVDVLPAFVLRVSAPRTAGLAVTQTIAIQNPSPDSFTDVRITAIAVRALTGEATGTVNTRLPISLGAAPAGGQTREGSLVMTLPSSNRWSQTITGSAINAGGRTISWTIRNEF
jgi:sugar lactone lactonase YvrE